MSTRKRARKKNPDRPLLPLGPHKDIFKLVQFYLDHVRMVDRQEYVGIFQQTLRMLKKGITLGQISQSIQNYAKDPWVKQQPEFKRKHIRQFFMPENIRQWARHTNTESSDPSLSVLARLNQDAMVRDAVPLPTWKADEPEIEENLCDEL